MAVVKLNIAQMHCSACSATIEKNLSLLPSIKNATINAVSGRGKIVYDETKISQKEIIDLITSYGFPASLDIKEKLELDYINGLRLRFFVALPLFFVIFILHMSGIHSVFSGILQLILASIVQIYCAYPFYKGAKNVLKTKSADMNLLIALGTSVAYIYSLYLFFSGSFGLYFEGSSAVICFVLAGEYLKARAKKRANDALAMLSNILPQNARILKDKNDKNPQNIATKDIKKGDLCLIVSGEKIPLDGVVISGSAEVSSAHINGEELPKYVQKDSVVIGGSLLLNGEILVESLKDAESFFVYEMIDLLEVAQEQKPPIGKLADKIASVFVPFVVLLSVISFALWLSFGASFDFALSIGACVLVISCPCALGLAVPLAIVCASIRAKRAEILVKSPSVYELAKEVKTIIFDKTGTLTKGEIVIKSCEISSKDSKSFVLSLLKSMQNHNPHPIAKAIMEYAKDAEFLELESKEYFIAKGVCAKFEGKEYYLGALEWVKSVAGVELENVENCIALARSGEVLAILQTQDALRDGANEMLKALRELKKEVVLLSGDSNISVEKVAKMLGITQFFAGVDPVQKAQIVADFAKKGGVCFVGDGINDALALKEASFGISFIEATQLAQEVGDVLLLKSDLWGVVEVFALSQKVLENIRQNLFFAYVYNVVLIPIAAGVLYPFFGIALQPAFAGAAMALSSFSVVSNALRISRVKLPKKVAYA